MSKKAEAKEDGAKKVKIGGVTSADGGGAAPVPKTSKKKDDESDSDVSEDEVHVERSVGGGDEHASA
jgi:hypothetical protein